MTHGPTHIQSNIDQSRTSKIYNVHVTNSEALVHRARGSREITHAAQEFYLNFEKRKTLVDKVEDIKIGMCIWQSFKKA